eukprot:GEMP01035007.1.p1 GENE.GEMP01035007.1~~GEMP01035007.1.p1  ORF type:complete len:544 (+),score=120.56 GEMP01035007.1:90-1721(+)
MPMPPPHFRLTNAEVPDHMVVPTSSVIKLHEITGNTASTLESDSDITISTVRPVVEVVQSSSRHRRKRPSKRTKDADRAPRKGRSPKGAGAGTTNSISDGSTAALLRSFEQPAKRRTTAETVNTKMRDLMRHITGLNDDSDRAYGEVSKLQGEVVRMRDEIVEARKTSCEERYLTTDRSILNLVFKTWVQLWENGRYERVMSDLQNHHATAVKTLEDNLHAQVEERKTIAEAKTLRVSQLEKENEMLRERLTTVEMCFKKAVESIKEIFERSGIEAAAVNSPKPQEHDTVYEERPASEYIRWKLHSLLEEVDPLYIPRLSSYTNTKSALPNPAPKKIVLPRFSVSSVHAPPSFHFPTSSLTPLGPQHLPGNQAAFARNPSFSAAKTTNTTCPTTGQPDTPASVTSTAASQPNSKRTPGDGATAAALGGPLVGPLVGDAFKWNVVSSRVMNPEQNAGTLLANNLRNTMLRYFDKGEGTVPVAKFPRMVPEHKSAGYKVAPSMLTPPAPLVQPDTVLPASSKARHRSLTPNIHRMKLIQPVIHLN